ncbi:MAG: hypothetical protein KGM24_09130, partial [Elusimicrobia bacterium]|nr:hypothetical protein [Elusimicrobiota bacterium]
MKRLVAASCALSLASCAPGAARVDVLSRAPSFTAKAVAIVSVRGAGARAGALTDALAARLRAGGTRAVALA